MATGAIRQSGMTEVNLEPVFRVMTIAAQTLVVIIWRLMATGAQASLKMIVVVIAPIIYIVTSRAF
jgi:hypothetical protein